MYKKDLALNNLQELICPKPNQPNTISKLEYGYHMISFCKYPMISRNINAGSIYSEERR